MCGFKGFVDTLLVNLYKAQHMLCHEHLII